MREDIEDLREFLRKLSVNELRVLINETRSEIKHRKEEITRQNLRILEAEVNNFLDGVGEGYTPGDYYAPTRYYSTLHGVKNIRISYGLTSDGKEKLLIVVKVYTPKGRLLPNKITLRNKEYEIVFLESKKYDPTIDY